MTTGQSIKGKRVLHIMPYPAVPTIGPCFRAVRQLKALRRAGMEVFLACPRVSDRVLLERALDSIFKGITVIADLFNSNVPLVREAGFLFFSRRRIEDIIRTVKPDIVHAHNPPDTLAFVTSSVCKRAGIPVIYDIHDSSLEVIGASGINFLLKKIYSIVAFYFEGKIIQNCSGIVTVSGSLRDLLLSSRKGLAVRNVPVAVMRNIEDNINILLQKKTENEGKYIFYSGTLYAKFIGLEVLLSSIKGLLRKKDVKFYIAGDGPYRKQLEAFIRDEQCSELVVMLGRIKREKAIEYAAEAIMTVIPYERNSLTEIALPNKLFEYMALGKAVVYPDFPGFREVLGDANKGMYIPDDKKDMERVIENMLSDGEMRKSEGNRNRELVKQFSFENEFDKLNKLYENVL